MIVRLLATLLVVSFFNASTALAETKIITAEATYIMGDGEAPSFAETMAIQKAKQTALEEAGTYVQSYAKVLNQQLTTDEIQTIAGGVLQVEILDKKRELVSDGLRVSVKIKATVTTDKVEELARRIKGKNVVEEYTKLQAEYAKLSRELEKQKQRAAKAPKGREREAALDQIREGEKAFAHAQQREADLFQRLVSGKQLVAQASRDKEIIDGLLKTIQTSGYIVTVGDVQAVTISGTSEPDMFAPYVPLTIRVSESLHEEMSQAVKALGGTMRPDIAVGLLNFSDTGAQPLKIVKDTRSEAKVTLVRLGKYLEITHDFQDGVMKLALVVTFLDGTSKPFSCYLGSSGDHRYYINGARASDLRGNDWPSWEESWFPLRRIFPVTKVWPAGTFGNKVSKEWIDNGEYDEAHLCKEQQRLRTSLIECRFPKARGGEPAGRDIPSEYGYVAIVRDEATFVVRLPFVLRAEEVKKLTGVRVRTVPITVADRISRKSDDFISSCLVVQ